MLSKLKRLSQTSPSKPTIYLLDVEVEFVKRKRKERRRTWAVSVFDTAEDLNEYDGKTIGRISKEMKLKNSRVTVVDVLSKKPLSKSTLTLDELKRQNRK